MTGRAIVLRGDARSLPLADDSVDLIVTSPPYFALRSYTDGGEHYEGQIGSEATPAEFIAALVACTREWMRVLKPSGSLWVNLGDKYSGSPSGPRKLNEDGWDRDRSYTVTRQPRRGMTVQPKSLLGLPWRYALACIDELGLILRAEVIWSKPNGLPESVRDRVRRSHEQWFHFTMQPRYFSAVDEIREPHAEPNGRAAYGRTRPAVSGGNRGTHVGLHAHADHRDMGQNPLGKLPGSVWEVSSEPLTVPEYLGIDHFAAFPTEWPRRIIQGWSPAGICVECGEGRRPVKGVDWSKVPHRIVEKRALSTSETAAWCARFADWCDGAGVTRTTLDAAAGTSDMGGWWASRLRHRAAVPTPQQWERLRIALDPPAEFDSLVYLTRQVPTSGSFGGDVNERGLMTTHRTGVGMASTKAPPRSITDYACACPEPTAETRPAVVLDPFGGTGTTALVASVLGRIGISVDMSADYCRLARWRTADGKQADKASRPIKWRQLKTIEPQIDLAETQYRRTVLGES